MFSYAFNDLQTEAKTVLLCGGKLFSYVCKLADSFDEGEENFVGDSEIIALGGASNETKDRPLG